MAVRAPFHLSNYRLKCLASERREDGSPGRLEGEIFRGSDCLGLRVQLAVVANWLDVRKASLV